METMTTGYAAKILSIVRSGKKVRYDERLRVRGKQCADRNGPRKHLIRSQGRYPTYQQFPRPFKSYSRHPVALGRILPLQAPIPLEGVTQLPDLRFYLYHLLLRPCNGRPLLLDGIRRDTGMIWQDPDNPSECRRSPLSLKRPACR